MGSVRRPFGDCDPWEAPPSRGTIDAMPPPVPLHATRRWLPSGRLARRTRGPLLGGLWLRVLTKWQAADLDRRLAAGADPMQSDELSLSDGEPLGIEGLAKTARLVDDRSSPMYRVGGALPEFLSAALTALERGHRTAAAGRR